MQSLYVKMHSCQGSSTQEEDQGVTRKTLKSRNVELEGNVLIQKACQALEMEATVTHLLGDKQADTRRLQVSSVTAAMENTSTICGAEGKPVL